MALLHFCTLQCQARAAQLACTKTCTKMQYRYEKQIRTDCFGVAKYKYNRTKCEQCEAFLVCTLRSPTLLCNICSSTAQQQFANLNIPEMTAHPAMMRMQHCIGNSSLLSSTETRGVREGTESPIRSSGTTTCLRPVGCSHSPQVSFFHS